MEGQGRFLSSELWQFIFNGLGIDDLKAVSLVCKDFLTDSSCLKESLEVLNPDIDMLSQHLNRFKLLKKLDLSRFEGDSDKAIGEIERSGINLESLDIIIHKLFDGSTKISSNLKALNCKFKTCFDDNALEVIAKTFPNLEQVGIEVLTHASIVPIGLGFEFSKLKLLKKIHLSSCMVCDQFIIALSLNCVLLKDVSIRFTPYVTEAGIAHLLRNRPNLEALCFDAPLPKKSSSIITFENSICHDKAFTIENSICHNKALTSLELLYMLNTDKVLRAIGKANLGLNSLQLKYCKDVTTSGLLAALSKGKLTKLSLQGGRGGADFTEEDLELLVLEGNVSHLTHLEINMSQALNCKLKIRFNDNALEVIAEILPNLEQLRIEARYAYSNPNAIGLGFECSKLKLLKKIHLSSCNVGDQFIIALSLNCVLLKDVAIGGSHHITESGLGHLLRNRPNLEALSFHAPEVPKPNYYSSSSINIENSVGHNKALTSLELMYMRNTDEVLEAIGKAKLGLNNLVLKHCKDVTASGLLAVLSNGKLTKLCLQGGRGGADFTEEDLRLLVLEGNVSHLTHLEINVSQLKDSTLFLLSTRCPSLIDIKVTEEAEPDEQVELDIIPFPKNHEITTLHLDMRRGIKEEFLKQLGLLLPNLKVLHLRNCAKDIEAILKSCKQIIELNLCVTWGEDSGNRNAKILSEANDPELVALNLEVLRLRFSMIDDEGLATITKICPRLLSLDLAYCPNITIKGIKQVVQNIKTLTSLNVKYFFNLYNYNALLKWMLSTGNFASLNKIVLHNGRITERQRDKFLLHGCLLSSV